MVVVLALAGALVAPAAARADSLHDVRAAVGQVRGSLAHRYDVTDDRGAPMDTLDIVQDGHTYVGVYHTASGPLYFDLQVATSTDLIHWTRRATLDSDSSQGTLARTAGGGFVVAYEKAKRPDLSHGLLQRAPYGLAALPTSQLRFRAYQDLAHLEAAQPSAEFTAPRRLGAQAEGTPNINWVDGSDPGSSTIAIGLHYLRDVNGDGAGDLDRQASGTLTGFSHWDVADDSVLNGELLHPTVLHAGFHTPPTGSFGDRDDFLFAGRTMAVDEVQYRKDDFNTWRLFLRDPATGRTLPLDVRTAGGSRAFGNPSITPVTTPHGRPALFVSIYVFGVGAAPGEAGPLTYVVGLPRRRPGAAHARTMISGSSVAR